MSAFAKKILLLCLAAIIAVSCGDDDAPTEPSEELPDPRQPVVPFMEFPSTDATFQATYLSTIVDSGLIGKITFIRGLASAVFRDANGNLAGPSKITVEGRSLSFNEGRYRYSPGTGFGIDYGSTSEWLVEGNTKVPNIDEEIDDFVPEIGDVNLGDSLDTSEELSLQIDMDNPYTNVGTPDSVNYIIAGKKTSLIRKTDYMEPVSFSVEELSGLGLGKAYIQVEAFRYQTRSYEDGYEVTYVHKGVFNKRVWVH